MTNISKIYIFTIHRSPAEPPSSLPPLPWIWVTQRSKFIFEVTSEWQVRIWVTWRSTCPTHQHTTSSEVSRKKVTQTCKYFHGNIIKLLDNLTLVPDKLYNENHQESVNLKCILYIHYKIRVQGIQIINQGSGKLAFDLICGTLGYPIMRGQSGELIFFLLVSDTLGCRHAFRTFTRHVLQKTDSKLFLSLIFHKPHIVFYHFAIKIAIYLHNLY